MRVESFSPNFGFDFGGHMTVLWLGLGTVLECWTSKLTFNDSRDVVNPPTPAPCSLAQPGPACAKGQTSQLAPPVGQILQ